MSDNTISEGEYQSWQCDVGDDIPRSTTEEWLTKDKRLIPVVDMIDAHLSNTVRMLRRQGLMMKMKAEISLLNGYDVVRGDMATDALEGEYQALQEMELDDFIKGRVPCFKLMLTEVARRKLVVPPPTEAERNAAEQIGLRWLLRKYPRYGR